MAGGNLGRVGRFGLTFSSLNHTGRVIIFFRISLSPLLPPTNYVAEMRPHGLKFCTAACIPLKTPSQTTPPVAGIGPVMCRTQHVKGLLCADLTWKPYMKFVSQKLSRVFGNGSIVCRTVG